MNIKQIDIALKLTEIYINNRTNFGYQFTEKEVMEVYEDFCEMLDKENKEW